jgi:hypothetical protein
VTVVPRAGGDCSPSGERAAAVLAASFLARMSRAKEHTSDGGGLDRVPAPSRAAEFPTEVAARGSARSCTASLTLRTAARSGLPPRAGAELLMAADGASGGQLDTGDRAPLDAMSSLGSAAAPGASPAVSPVAAATDSEAGSAAASLERGGAALLFFLRRGLSRVGHMEAACPFATCMDAAYCLVHSRREHTHEPFLPPCTCAGTPRGQPTGNAAPQLTCVDAVAALRDGQRGIAWRS